MAEDRNRKFLGELEFKFGESFKDLDAKIEDINRALKQTEAIGQRIDKMTFAKDLDRAFQSLHLALKELDKTSERALTNARKQLDSTNKAVKDLIHNLKIEKLKPKDFLDKAKPIRESQTFEKLNQATQRQLVAAIKSADRAVEQQQRAILDKLEKERKAVDDLAREYIHLKQIKQLAAKEFVKDASLFLEKGMFSQLDRTTQKQLVRELESANQELDKAKEKASAFYKINQQVVDLLQKRKLGEISDRQFIEQGSQYLELKHRGALQEETLVKLKKELLKADKEITKELNMQMRVKDKQIKQEQKLAEHNAKLLRDSIEKKYASQLTQIGQLAKEIDPLMGMGQSSSGLESKIADAFIYTTSFYGLQGFRQAMSDAKETNRQFEEGLIDLSRTLTDFTQRDMQQFGRAAIDMSKDFGIPLREVQVAMTELARAGIENRNDLLTMTDTVSTGINTTSIKDAADMTGYLVSTVKQMNMEFADSMDIIDSWNKMADSYAVQTNDFAEAVSRAGSASQLLGIDLDHLNAMVVILGEATQASGHMIGTALRAIETRLLRPDTVKTLEEMGIQVKKDTDTFHDFKTIMDQVNDKLNEFGDNSIQANKMMDALGGAWRKNWVQILADDWDKVEKLAKESADSAGYSVEKNEKTMQSYAKQVEVLKNTIRELYVSIGQEGGVLEQLKFLVQQGINVVEFFNNLSPAIKQNIVLALELGTAYHLLSAGVKAVTGTGLTDWLRESIPALRELTDVSNAYDAAQIALGKAIEKYNLSSQDQAAIMDLVATKLGIAKVSADGLAASETVLNVTTKSLIKSKLILSGVITAITIGLTALISKIKKHRDEQKNLVQNTLSQIDAHDREYKTINELIEEYQELESQSNKTIEEKQRLLDVTKELVRLLPDSSSVIGDETKSISEQTEELKKLNAEKQLFELDQLIDKQFEKKFDKTVKNFKSAQEWIAGYEEVLESLQTQGKASGFVFDNMNEALHKQRGIALEAQADIAGMVSVYKDWAEAVATVNGVAVEDVDVIYRHIDGLVDMNASFDEIKDSVNNLTTDLMELSHTSVYHSLKESVKSFNEETDHSIEQLEKQRSEILEIQKLAQKQLPKRQFDVFNVVSKDHLQDIKRQQAELNNLEKMQQKMKISNQDLNKTLKKLNENHAISASTLRRLIQAYPELLEHMGNEKELAAEIARILNAESRQRDEVSEAYQEYSEQLERATERAQTLNEILYELNKEHVLSAETLQTVISQFPELIGYLDSEASLRERLIELIDLEQRTQIEAYNNKLMSSSVYFNEMKRGNSDLWNTIADHYGADAENFYTLADVKNKIDQDVARLVGDRWKTLYGSREQALSAKLKALRSLRSRYDPMLYPTPAMKALDRQIREIESLMAALSGYTGLQDVVGGQVKKIPFKKINVGTIKTSKPEKTSTNSTKKKKTEKEIYKPEVDRYRNLNAAIERQNYLLELNSVLQDRVENPRRIKILDQRIKQYQQLEKAYKNINKERVKERNEIAKKLRQQGFQINKQGKITNYQSRLKKLTGDTAQEVEELISRYDALTDSIIQTNITIEQNINEINNLTKQMQEVAREVAHSIDETHKKSTKKWQQQISLLGNIDTTKEVKDQIYYLQRLRREYENQLKTIQASINRAQQERRKASNSRQKKAFEAFIEEMEQQKIEILIEYVHNEDSIFQAQKNAQSMVKNAKENQLQALQSIEAQVINLIRKKYETERKLIEENHKKAVDSLNEQKKDYQDIVNERIRLLDEQEADREYHKQLKKMFEEKLELQRKHDSLLVDSSEESAAARAEILDNIDKKQEEIDEFRHQRSIDLRRQNYQDAIDKNNQEIEDKIDKLKQEHEEYKKLMEERLRNDKLYSEARKVMMADVFEDANGKIMKLSDALIEYENRWGEGLSVTGQLIKQELIDNLETAHKTLKNLSEVLEEIRNQQQKIQKDEGFIPTLPNLSNVGTGKAPQSVKDMFKSAPSIADPFPNVSSSGSGSSSASKPNVSSVARTLKQGTRGNDVKRLQQALNQLVGAKLAVDGIFGSKTKAAVRKFQSQAGISADGIVGRNTKAQFKKRGYAEGGVNDTPGMFKLHGERQKVETIFNAEQGRKLFNFVNSLPKEFLVNVPRVEMPQTQTDVVVPIQIDHLIHVAGNVDEKVIPQIKAVGDDAVKKLQKAMRKQGRF